MISHAGIVEPHAAEQGRGDARLQLLPVFCQSIETVGKLDRYLQPCILLAHGTLQNGIDADLGGDCYSLLLTFRIRKHHAAGGNADAGLQSEEIDEFVRQPVGKDIDGGSSASARNGMSAPVAPAPVLKVCAWSPRTASCEPELPLKNCGP